jgi:hypothetical protein
MGPRPEITTCAQVEQYSSQLGRMEFALFVYPIAYQGEDLSISTLEAELSWPDTWLLDRWECCNHAEGTLAEQGCGALLSLSWSPPRRMVDEVFLVARVAFYAWAAGPLAFPMEVPIAVRGDQGSFQMYAWGVEGRAGALCGDCTFPCLGSGSLYCTPGITPEVAEVFLAPGGTRLISFAVDAVSAAGPQYPCDLTAEGSEPWMEVTVIPLSWPEYRLDVHLSAAGMNQGEYHGWVRAMSRCTACAAVVLTVGSTADIQTDEPARLSSWGRLKYTFR